MTIPVFAIGCVLTKITVIYAHSFSPLLLVLQASGVSSSSSACSEYSEASSEYSDFSATSATDFHIGRLMSMSHHLKMWQRTVQPKIDEAMVRNHSLCLHGAQDPPQVIRLENPEKIRLFLLVHLSRLCLVVEFCRRHAWKAVETDSSSGSSAIRAFDFNISKLTSLLHTALAELKS